jgi:hypothetical protein
MSDALEAPPMKANAHYDPFTSGVANKDDWSVYATSHPCSSCFGNVSECFPSLCSDACSLYEETSCFVDPKSAHEHAKACELAKKRCFFQSLQELASKLQRRKQNMMQRKKTENPAERISNVVAIFEPNKNQLYCAGSIIGKQTWAMDRPCSKYFAEVTDACLCLCRDACAKYQFEYEVTGNEPVDKLQKDVFFFQFLQEWASSQIDKCSKTLDRFLPCSTESKHETVPLTAAARSAVNVQHITVPLTAIARSKKQKVVEENVEPLVEPLIAIARSKKQKLVEENVEPLAKKHKLGFFWDMFDTKFPNQQRTTVFTCPTSKQKSGVFKLLYCIGSHRPNEWLCKDDKIFLTKESGGVITTNRDWHGNQITRADGEPKENSLLKYQFHFGNLPHTYFMVWKPHHRWSKCPAIEFCDAKCPNIDTCPKSE